MRKTSPCKMLTSMMDNGDLNKYAFQRSPVLDEKTTRVSRTVARRLVLEGQLGNTSLCGFLKSPKGLSARSSCQTRLWCFGFQDLVARVCLPKTAGQIVRSWPNGHVGRRGDAGWAQEAHLLSCTELCVFLSPAIPLSRECSFGSKIR